MVELADRSIVAWIQEKGIKNEKGEPITFHNHLFLYDIYLDESPNLVVMKAAQVGMSTLEVLKNFYDANYRAMDIIYTLPTDGDVGIFVGGKVNRLIANNPVLQEYTADKDSIEQKQVGKSMVYFRGTWSKKAAIMITADRLVHDEKDSSKQDVILDYQARLQHSKIKQTHVFSHPSVPNNGVDVEWRISDQKEWFIQCPHCNHWQFLSWNTEDPKKMSIDIDAKTFICKKCRGVLHDSDRAIGEWRARKTKEAPKFSGYHVSLLMNPEISAKDIVSKYEDVTTGKQTMDFFYNKVLGLPYAGGGNIVTEDMVYNAISEDKNRYEGRLVCGVDTGVALRYVIGNVQGLVSFGEMKAYIPDKKLGIALEDSLEYFLIRFPDLIMVIDQGGDIVGSRQLREKYPGRVFLCHYARDRKTMQLIRWGKSDESGNVVVDRNRMLQLIVDEMRDTRLRLYNGDKGQWHAYALHWTHIYRVWKEDALGVNQYVWLRNDRDDWVHATLYWRVGISRFGGSGVVFMPEQEKKPNSYMLNPDGTVSFNPDEMFRKPELGWNDADDSDDWRNI